MRNKKPISRKSDWANQLVEALKQERLQYLESIQHLKPLEKAEAFLRRVASKFENYGDQEALIYLSSRGQNCKSFIKELTRTWRSAAEEIIENNLTPETHNIDTGKTQKMRRPSAEREKEIREIKNTSSFWMRNFWGFYDHQEFSIDATMLRTVQWCRIKGFEGWWQRLAKEELASVLQCGVYGLPGIYKLFFYVRSDLAVESMHDSLTRVLDAVTIPETGQEAPWKFIRPQAKHPKTKYVAETHYVCAATLLFASKRLNFTLRKEQSKTALKILLEGQRRCGAWPIWEMSNGSSVEATAIAIHALVLWKPNGWKKAVQKASNWLWSMQNETGVWSDPTAPDEVHLTVLVLDALELAADGRQVTFDVSRPKVKQSNERYQYDAFISHATEDKLILVRPLAKALAKEGLRIWYDEFELKIGDSLRESIDRGLAKSAYGIVVLSKAFFAKRWTRYELNGLVAKEMDGRKLILPIWHTITKKQILKHSPTLADKRAGMSEWGVKRLARDLSLVIKT